MYKLAKIFLSASSLLILPAFSYADIFYDAKKAAEIANLHHVESVRSTTEYLCGSATLYISSYAAEADINGRQASITAKIVSKDKSQDISKLMKKAISANDLLQKSVIVACNKNSGAFKVTFSPGTNFKGDIKTVTNVEIYTDGTVIGSRSRTIVEKK